MEGMVSLMLDGHPFAQCFSISSDIRLKQEMNNSACLGYILEGRQEFYGPTEKLIATDRESILMKCGNFLATVANTTEAEPYKSVVFHLDPETIKKAFEGKDMSFLTIKKEDAPKNPAMKIAKNQLLDSFVESMMPYFDQPELGSEELLAVKLQELVIILSQAGENVLATQLLGTIRTPTQIRFEDVIEANLYNNLSIPELAHLTASSESTFKRLFKKYYQESPAKYLRTKRLEKSRKLLRSSELSVSEIAWDCGFENPAHFSTTFSSSYGMSPKEFRLK